MSVVARAAQASKVEPSATALLWLVGLAALPLGANRPWAWNLAAGVAAVLLLVSVRPRSSPIFAVAPGRLRLPILLFGVVVAYIVVQLAPVPPSVAAPAWELAAELLDREVWYRISVAPDMGIVALTRLLFYAGIFWLALQAHRRPEAADRAMLALALLGAAHALAGVLAFAATEERLLWFGRSQDGTSLSGTFVNRNHFATFIGLGFICALGICARRAAEVMAGRGGGRWTDALLEVRLSTILVVASLPVDIAALLLSRSRAGFAATAVAGLVFVVGATWRLGLGRLAAAAVVLISVATFGLYAGVSGAALQERLALLVADEQLEYRYPLFRRTIDAIAEAPWLGRGYGTFEDSFRPFRQPPIDVQFDRAHNSYLELALELGIPMAAVLTLVPMLLALRASRALRRKGPTLYYGWAAACAGLLVGLHALADFSLQIPAVAMLFATMLGIGCAQSWSLREDTSRPPSRA